MLLPGRRLLFLLHLGIGSLDTGVGQEEVFGVDGSSPLLDPKIGADLSKSDVVWEFTGSDRRLLTILDYVPNYSKLEPNEQFKLRLRFNVSTGSLRIINATSRDQGVYKITVDGKLRGSRVLKLIEPLSEPLINDSCVNTTIELTCQVSLGNASSIQWWKDGEMIVNGQHYQLVQNNSTLIISEANKSAYGNYTCNVENPVSKSSHTLSVNGQECEPAASVQMIVIPVVVVLLLLLAVVIFFLMVCRKYKKKGQLDLQQYIPVHKIMNFNFMS
ncbi:HEPACAM family member 2-like isoform X1 [Carcharodon carcharias]|uniref:HEPACAM family member 2-like isoform X1 n=1 Tax=Carcharodon carcharias TaxID=13397 RepID=UPI001B7F5F88|nr:HEPACAM family member 2-like isoform X1 [Carcharodon carcharias]